MDTAAFNSPEVGHKEALGEHANFPEQPKQTGETVHALGKVWRVSDDENRIKAHFEQWVQDAALKVIAEVLESGQIDEAARMRSTYLGDRGAGKYTWDGEHCRSARSDLPGLRYLFYLLLKRCHPDMTEKRAYRIQRANPEACGMAISWALGNWEARDLTDEEPGQKPKTTQEPPTTDRR
jgi:hypothetical protein